MTTIMKTKKFIIIFVALFILMLLANQGISLAAIEVQSFCQLSVQVMQYEVIHLQELILIMNQYPDDPQTQAQQIDAKQAEYDQTLTSLYTSFGTTGNEYVTYLGKYDH